MKKRKKFILRFVRAAFFSGELCLVTDLALALNDRPAEMNTMLYCFAGLTLLLTVLQRFMKNGIERLCSLFTGLLAVICLSAAVIWNVFYVNAGYEEPDNGLTAASGSFFRNRNVMVIVPHQDDDLNLLGGVFEEYVSGGSTVRVVFTTNGDYRDMGALRINEAIKVLGSCGIPEENVIFLGYGDSWDGTHLYNAPAGEVQTSHAGYTATYGTESHPAWTTGTPYTSDNFLTDLQSVIETYLPDVLYCVDYDGHADHKAASMFFEKAMGRILKARPDYTPLVFKGFAYSTAYYATQDFYSLNLRSSARPDSGDYMSHAHIFRWDDRVRVPVSASTLSRSLLKSALYEKTGMYATQTAQQQATGIINGDKVFWQRESASLTYDAEVTATSGEPERLNDFMLSESIDVNSEKRMPYDGIWTPYAGDEEKLAVITFPEPVTVDRITLYDNPSLIDNVLDAELILYPYSENSDSGDPDTAANDSEVSHSGDRNGEAPVSNVPYSGDPAGKASAGKTPDSASSGNGAPVILRTGSLNTGGEPTEFLFEPVTISSFSIRLLETEGNGAGLAEAEAYCGRQDYGMELLKICDADGNFIYDYVYPDGETAEFTLYALNCGTSDNSEPDNGMDLSGYEITCSSDTCSVTILDNSTFSVRVPKGERSVLTVRALGGSGGSGSGSGGSFSEHPNPDIISPDSLVSDSVILRNDGTLMKLGQGIESFVWHNYGKLQTTAAYTLAKTLFHVLTERI